ncbi:MAG: DUF6457 domain-containing protein [Nocardioidaceae bacterium]|nr:DUF6457 domain-containing protein [Nocardioidaceae bacterium]
MSLPAWTDHVRDSLGIETEVDLKSLLDATRDIAHAVERPAAPVTAFLIGYAAAQRGGTPADVDAVTARVLELVAAWPAQD